MNANLTRPALLFLAAATFATGCEDRNPMDDLIDPIEICDATFGSLTKNSPRGYPVNQYTAEEQVVVLVWHYTGVIENSGFGGVIGRSIPGDPDFSLLRNAFRQLGATELDTLLDKGFAVFDPDQIENVDYRRQVWEELSEEKVHHLNVAFFKVTDSVVPELLAEFICKQRSEGRLPK